MRRSSWWMIALLATGVAVSPTPLAAATPEDDRTITIELAAPPSLLPDLRVGLWLGDEEITDQYCEPATSRTASSDRAFLRCTGLPEGAEHRVGLAGPVPDGVTGSVTCGVDTGLWSEVPPIWEPSSDEELCIVWASTPGLLLRRGERTLADGSSVELGFGVSLADGSSAPPCEPDQLYGEAVHWCTGLPFGEHVVEVVPPEGYRAVLLCESADTTHLRMWEGAAGVSAEHPLWICSAASFGPPLAVRASIWEPDASSWASQLSVSVTAEDGRDVGQSCDVRGAEAVIPDPVLERPDAVWRVDCPGLPSGSYVVRVVGVPEHVAVWTPGELDGPVGGNLCEVEVTESSIDECYFGLDGRGTPATTAPTTTPASTTTPTLPETGGHAPGSAIVTAAGAIALGLLLVVLARRRAPG